MKLEPYTEELRGCPVKGSRAPITSDSDFIRR